MLGKFAVIIGPALMGAVGLIVKRVMMPPAPTPGQIQTVGELASRMSIASLLLLFIAGAAIFYFVDEEKGKEEIQFFK